MAPDRRPNALAQENSLMKRNSGSRRVRRTLHRTLRIVTPRLGGPRVDGRVALAVLWALGRLAQRLGPAA